MKKNLKVIGILFLMILTIIGALFYNTYSQLKRLNKGELETEITTDTIPFTYSSYGHILLSTKINNSKKDYQFILDSGSSNFIFKKFQSENNLDSNGYAIGRNSSGSIFFSKIKKINSLQLKNFKFVNLNAKEIEFNFDCSEDIYGIIGIGLMRQLIWNIDFKTQKIIVSKNLNKFKFQDNKIELSLSESKLSHHISTKLKFRKNKKNTSVLVDLGSNGTLRLMEEDVLKDSLKFKSKQIFGIGSIGLNTNMERKSEERFYLLDSVIFDKSSYSINNVPVLTSPKGLKLLGLGFFKKYKTTISWIDRKIILEPYDSIQNFNKKTYGFSTKHDKEKNKIFVTSITENSSASNLNLPLNSEVLSINNEPLTDFKAYCDDQNRKNLEDTIRLKIKYNDSIKQFLIKKEKLFNN